MRADDRADLIGFRRAPQNAGISIERRPQVSFRHEAVADHSRGAPCVPGVEGTASAAKKPFSRVEQDICLRGYPLNAIRSSLGAFLAAALRPQTPLAKAIVAVLVVKLIAIAGIGAFMLASRGQAPVGAEAMARLLGPAISQQEGER
jgi:hypothetical protein